MTRLSPIPIPPCDLVRAALALDEQVEDPRQHFGGDPDSRVPDPHHDLIPSRSAVSPIRPPMSVYLTAFVRRFRRICSSLVGSASSRIDSSGSEMWSSRLPLIDQGLDRLDHLGDGFGQDHDLLLQLDLVPG